MSNPVNKLAYRVISDSSSVAGATSIVLNGGIALQSVIENPNRRYLYLSNKGISYPIYLGLDNTVTAGASGANFSILKTGERMELENYSGPLYAIHSGASGTYEQLGVLDIG